MARASKIARPVVGHDADEAEALEAASLVLQTHARVENPEAVTAAVISKWVIERMKRCVAGRMADAVVFDLGDAKLTGMIEAALPKVGEALAGAGFDFSKAFSDLSKDEIISVLVAGCVAHREAAVAAGENPNFPFDDPIPFGDNANG